MSTALTETYINPHVIRGLCNTIKTLTERLHVVIEYTEIAEDVGVYDGETRTAYVDLASSAEDQLWFLANLWWVLAVGDWTLDPYAVRRPSLRLVPEPRCELNPV